MTWTKTEINFTLHHIGPRNNFNVPADHIPGGRVGNDVALGKPKIRHTLTQARNLVTIYSGTQPDFNRYLPTASANQKINFGTS